MGSGRELSSQFQILGNVLIKRFSEDVLLDEWRQHNVMTSGGLSLIADFFAAPLRELVPIPPSYLVYGSGNVTVGRYMAQVPGETFRGQIVSRQKSGFTTIFHGYLATSDNNSQSVATLGLVAGDASITPQSGTLVAIANVTSPFGKDSGHSYSIEWSITVSGVVS